MINERESNINVIKYKIEEFETVDDFTEHMLKINPIVGIIPLGRKDDEFLVPISKYQWLDDYLKENVRTLEEALSILEQYDELIKLLDNYMIPSEELILNFDYAFMDGDTLMLMLIPSSFSKFLSRSRREFTLSLLAAPNYVSDEERLKVFDYIQGPRLPVEGRSREASCGCFSASRYDFEPKRISLFNKNFKEKINTDKNSVNRSGINESGINTNYNNKNTIYDDLIANDNQIKKNRFSFLKEKLLGGPTDDIFEFSNEELLPEGVNVIKVRSTGAEYPLMYGPDLIGTDPSKCSICFPGNVTMETEHCSITLARGHYFVADLNSKSGTCLNGQQLEPGKTYELHSADLITVAGEELVFSKRT